MYEASSDHNIVFASDVVLKSPSALAYGPEKFASMMIPQSFDETPPLLRRLSSVWCRPRFFDHKGVHIRETAAIIALINIR